MNILDYFHRKGLCELNVREQEDVISYHYIFNHRFKKEQRIEDVDLFNKLVHLCEQLQELGYITGLSVVNRSQLMVAYAFVKPNHVRHYGVDVAGDHIPEGTLVAMGADGIKKYTSPKLFDPELLSKMIESSKKDWATIEFPKGIEKIEGTFTASTPKDKSYSIKDWKAIMDMDLSVPKDWWDTDTGKAHEFKSSKEAKEFYDSIKGKLKDVQKRKKKHIIIGRKDEVLRHLQKAKIKG